jgi:hypothetical protein
MNLTIRKPNLEPKTPEGIPQDSANVRDYFNLGLSEGKLKYIPRTTPITNEEILERWIPSWSQSDNITLLAELNGKIVGSITVFDDTASTDYEHASQRPPGAVGGTIDPRVDFETVAKPLYTALIETLKRENRKAIFTFAEESPSKKVMEDLCGPGQILENQERYSAVGLSGRVIKYELP